MENDYQKFTDEDKEDDLEYDESTERKIKQQKIMFFAFMAFGIISLVLAFYQLKYSLRSPFFEDVPADAEIGQSDLAVKKDDSFFLQNTDTDKDGLTDYDELYVYDTSPYLADSDSDGFTDKQELDTKNNPNCPENKNCGLYLDKTFVASSSPPVITPEYLLGGINTSASGIDVNALRQTLLQAGVPADVLAQISDEALLQEYANIAGTSSASGVSGISGNSNSDILNLNKEDLSNLTPQEIRTLLESKGIDKKILDSIDDNTLKKDFLDTLSSTKQ